jgi:hypothetical protein
MDREFENGLDLGDLEVEGPRPEIVKAWQGTFHFCCPSGGGEWGSARISPEQARRLAHWLLAKADAQLNTSSSAPPLGSS